MEATLLLLIAIPLQPKAVIRDRVDLIEVNHMHDWKTTEKTFTQLVFWKWDSLDSRNHVVAWTMLQKFHLPIRRWDLEGVYVFQFRDRNQRLREVSAPRCIETSTLHDPEIEDREWLPPEKRIGLAERKWF